MNRISRDVFKLHLSSRRFPSRIPQPFINSSRYFISSSINDNPLPTPSSDSKTTIQTEQKTIQLKADVGKMIIGFTCNICKTRQFKSMSKKSYTEGLVIIKCTPCKTNHLIADHLGWFDSMNKAGTIQDIIKAKTGQDIDVKSLDSHMDADALLEWLPDNEHKIK